MADGFAGYRPFLVFPQAEEGPSAFVGYRPYLVAVTSDPGSGTGWSSSLQVLFSGRGVSSARVDIPALASLTWGGQSPAGSLSAAGVLTLSFSTVTVQASKLSAVASFSGLWEGTQLAAPASFSIGATANVSWLTDVGSAFSIYESRTTMNPTGMAIASADFISPSSAVVFWNPAQVPTGTAVLVSATATLEGVGASIQNSEVSAASSLTAAFDPAPFVARQADWPSASSITFGSFEFRPGDIALDAQAAATFSPAGASTNSVQASLVQNLSVTFLSSPSLGTEADSRAAASVTFVGAEIQQNAPFSVQASAIVGWISLPAVFVDTEVSIVAASFGAFDTQELQPTGPFKFSSLSSLIFTSRPSAIQFGEDDDEVGRRRSLWAGAAEAERELAAKVWRNDEEDLTILAAALAAALAETRTLQ